MPAHTRHRTARETKILKVLAQFDRPIQIDQLRSTTALPKQVLTDILDLLVRLGEIVQFDGTGIVDHKKTVVQITDKARAELNDEQGQ